MGVSGSSLLIESINSMIGSKTESREREREGGGEGGGRGGKERERNVYNTSMYPYAEAHPLVTPSKNLVKAILHCD